MPPELAIGEVARRAGLAPSAIRYYERAGLLAKPERRSGRRRYQGAILGRLRIIQVAREAGFTLAEIRLLLSGFSEAATPAARWRALAERKLAELEQLSRRIAHMRRLLESSFQCRCLRIEDCERALLAMERRAATPNARRP